MVAVYRSLALVVLLLVACSSGDGGEDGSGASTDPSLTTTSAPAAPEPLTATDPGTGAVSIGGTVSSFEVTRCEPEGDPSQPEAARPLFRLAGSGTTTEGEAFTIDVLRFVTGTEFKTFTDTITYAAGSQVLQAQRVEVNGEVTDPRDPDATSALLRVRDDGVSAQGIAGLPGSQAGAADLVGLALEATCA